MTTDTDVLVVGAGPTGLTTALEASAHGASVRIVDRRSQLFRPSRAMMLHARALECLRPLGVTTELLDRADTSPEVRLHLGVRAVQVRLGRVDLSDTAFPHLTLVRQADVEDVLCSALLARGIRVEWGTEFVGPRAIGGGEGGVRAVLRSPGSRDTQHRSRFVVGCDGQTSTVRTLVGAAWRGAPYRVEAILADIELGSALEPGLLHVAVGPSGLTFLFALGEGATWRMLATRPARAAASGSFGQLGPSVPADEVRLLLRGTGLAGTIERVSWSARVPLQHRVASVFRRGSLFLAGDAAHAHSPAGGQGMNNGILDAVNLGWKLGFAATGSPTPELLDSYEVERRRAAQEVLVLTHLIFFAEASPNPVARLGRGVLLPVVAPLLPLLMRQRLLTAAAVRLLAQPYVRYRHSPISRDALPRGGRRSRPGDRLPDQTVVVDGGTARLHQLTASPGIHLLLGRDVPDDAADDTLPTGPMLHRHRLDDRPGTELVAVRPDGYIGFRCEAGDRHLLAEWLQRLGAL
ncbi:FAD-dependent monooxygenase [Leifsonia sp. McL0607]|uniref:FAD-dependent monooxygenase n=1 Tax=Leifsonia sp. McL0607 TaxID=3415672 RepID=UPI003CF7A628